MEQKLTIIRVIKILLGHRAHGWHFSSATHFPHPVLEEIRAILASKHRQQLRRVLSWSVLSDFYGTTSVSTGRKEKDKPEAVCPPKAVSASQAPAGLGVPWRAGENRVLGLSPEFLA